MGASKSKTKKLSPKTISELQKNIDVDFSKEEIEQWFKEYQSSLKGGHDRLTMIEFKDVYNSVFDGDASEFVEHLFRFFDADNDGFVDFKEFIIGLCVSGSDNVETKLKWAFKMYDIDGNGFITRDEMAGILRAIFKMISGKSSQQEADTPTAHDIIQQFFETADKDHDDRISLEEFVEGSKNMPMILNLLQCDPDAGNVEADAVKFDTLDSEHAAGGETVVDQGKSASRSSAYAVE